jgi:hypothetical protein
VTEYGVADLRGRGDRDCAAAMLAVADSAFQDELLDHAKRAGKIERGYRIPEGHSRNRPEFVSEALDEARRQGWCAPFPFGTDFTPEEQRLLPALDRLKQASASKVSLARAVMQSLGRNGPDASEAAALRRMGLDKPATLRERLYSRLLLWALRTG